VAKGKKGKLVQPLPSGHHTLQCATSSNVLVKVIRLSVVFIIIIIKARATLVAFSNVLFFSPTVSPRLLLAVYITMAACHFSGRDHHQQQQQQQQQENTVLNLMHDHIKHSHMQLQADPERCPFIRF